MLTGCGFRREVWVAVHAAVRVGHMIQRDSWSHETAEKPHATFGTSSVSESDTGSQRELVTELASHFPHALFLAEEEGLDAARAADPQKPGFIRSTVFGIDPLDGSTENAHRLPNWCTSVGVMMHGLHVGGAIFAPDIRGGLLVAGDTEKGAFLWEYDRKAPQSVRVASGTKKPIVQLGLDVQRSNKYAEFVKALPKNLRPRGIAPSGALGLALVAAGRVDALVQSPQMPWDWFAGLPMVIAAGGLVRAFLVEGGEILPVGFPNGKTAYYDTTKQTLGFVAGNPEIVDELFTTLRRTYRDDA